MVESVDQMSPDASPGEVSTRSGVRRVNNLPMYILGGVLLAFLVVMALVAADRAARQSTPVDGPKEKAGNTSMFANEIVGDMTGGMIEPASALVPPEMPTEAEPNPANLHTIRAFKTTQDFCNDLFWVFATWVIACDHYLICIPFSNTPHHRTLTYITIATATKYTP